MSHIYALSSQYRALWIAIHTSRTWACAQALFHARQWLSRGRSRGPPPGHSGTALNVQEGAWGNRLSRRALFGHSPARNDPYSESLSHQRQDVEQGVGIGATGRSHKDPIPARDAALLGESPLGDLEQGGRMGAGHLIFTLGRILCRTRVHPSRPAPRRDAYGMDSRANTRRPARRNARIAHRKNVAVAPPLPAAGESQRASSCVFMHRRVSAH